MLEKSLIFRGRDRQEDGLKKENERLKSLIGELTIELKKSDGTFV